MVDIGVVFGRFQILHLKHMEYFLAAKMRCKKLLIGIANPDGGFGEKQDKENPLTYYERFQMIHGALIDFGVKREEFEIVPFPIENPELFLNYVPKDASYYVSISDEADEKNLKVLEEKELKIEVLWRKEPETKGITGTEVRTLIAEGEEWKPFVPKKVYEYVVSKSLDDRIKKLYEGPGEEAEEDQDEENESDTGREEQ